jgi:hypothetical protein
VRHKSFLIIWLAVAAAVVGVPLLLFAGREPPCNKVCASGKAELSAIVPKGWREDEPLVFQAADPEQRQPFTRWDVKYVVKGKAEDAVRRLDAAARRAGWQAEPDCRVPDRVAGCWRKAELRLSATGYTDKDRSEAWIDVSMHVNNPTPQLPDLITPS